MNVEMEVVGMVMTCEVGNVEMVKRDFFFFFFTATVIRFICIYT